MLRVRYLAGLKGREGRMRKKGGERQGEEKNERIIRQARQARRVQVNSVMTLPTVRSRKKERN